MPKVTGAEDNLKFYKSYKGRLSYLADVKGRNIIKRYVPTRKYTSGAGDIIALTLANSRQEWQALSQAEKDTWNNKASEFEMTGYELYIQEGFKEGFNAISGVGLSKFCFSNGVIE